MAMEEDSKIPIMLGRLFLNTVRAIIYVNVESLPLKWKMKIYLVFTVKTYESIHLNGSIIIKDIPWGDVINPL